MVIYINTGDTVTQFIPITSTILSSNSDCKKLKISTFERISSCKEAGDHCCTHSDGRFHTMHLSRIDNRPTNIQSKVSLMSKKVKWQVVPSALLTVIREQYKLQSSLYNFIHLPCCSSLLGSNILAITVLIFCVCCLICYLGM